MHNYGTIHRPQGHSTSASMSQNEEPKGLPEKKCCRFQVLFPYNIPLTLEATAVRIIRNLCHFGLFYSLFLWIILSISLIPKRKLSLLWLIVMTNVTCLYLLLLKAFPNSVVLHKIVDKRLVIAFLVIVTAVELIITRAGIHLLVIQAVGIPVILVHAALRVTDDVYVDQEACAADELVPSANKDGKELESQVSV